MAGYRAILFDMDGVLVDSEPLFLSAINRLLVQEGVEPVSVRENEEFLIGTTIGETWRQLKIHRPLPLPADEYIQPLRRHCAAGYAGRAGTPAGGAETNSGL